MGNSGSISVGQAALFFGLGYILGCFNTGYYLVRFRTGQDVRRLGTGTAGARNVSRVLGRTGFLLTVGGDILKGTVTAALALWLSQDDRMALLAIMGVIAGHVWPVQLGFRGGKGVATSLGALLLYDWKLTSVYVAVFITGYLLTKKSTICGLVAFAVLPLAAWFLHQDRSHIIGISVLAGLILLTHHQNVTSELNHLLPRRVPPGSDTLS